MSKGKKKKKIEPLEKKEGELSVEDLDGVSGGVTVGEAVVDEAVDVGAPLKIKTDIKGGIGRIMKE